jgi:Wings apart-like protein regulation of heterochromatin
METLLSMTSKRAGEWFKEELRELGGLGHLAKTFRYSTPLTPYIKTILIFLGENSILLTVSEKISQIFLISWKVIFTVSTLCVPVP